jgi:hypothetical protein
MAAPSHDDDPLGAMMMATAPPHPLAGPVPYPGSLPSPRRGGGGLGFADHGYYLSDDDDDDDGSSSSENGGDDCDAGEDGDGRSSQEGGELGDDLRELRYLSERVHVFAPDGERARRRWEEDRIRSLRTMGGPAPDEDDDRDGLLIGFPSADDGPPPPSRSYSSASDSPRSPPGAATTAATATGTGRKKKKKSRARRMKSLVSRGAKKLWLPGLIQQMERDQELSNALDAVNRETWEENERQRMVREAKGGGLRIVREHLEEFLDGGRDGKEEDDVPLTYEGWIALLHPDNVTEEAGEDGADGPPAADVVIDHRFYVADSDHRRLWNDSLAERDDGDRRAYVPSRKVRPWDRSARGIAATGGDASSSASRSRLPPPPQAPGAVAERMWAT